MLQPLVCRPPALSMSLLLYGPQLLFCLSHCMPACLPACLPASPTRLAKLSLVTSRLGERGVKEDFPPEPNRGQDSFALNHLGTCLRLRELYSNIMYTAVTCASTLFATMQASAKQRLQRLPTHRFPSSTAADSTSTHHR